MDIVGHDLTNRLVGQLLSALRPAAAKDVESELPVLAHSAGHDLHIVVSEHVLHRKAEHAVIRCVGRGLPALEIVGAALWIHVDHEHPHRGVHVRYPLDGNDLLFLGPPTKVRVDHLEHRVLGIDGDVGLRHRGRHDHGGGRGLGGTSG